MRLYSKDDLKDSRIFFDKMPPKFGTIFTIFTLALIICSLFVSTIINKIYIVKAQGVIKSSNTQYVSSNVNGMIVEILAEEGSEVKEGDTILIISDGNESSQEEALILQLNLANEKIEAMNKYQKSLDDGINYMLNEGIEQEFYGYMDYYLKQVKSESYTKNEEIADIEKQKSKINDTKNELRSLENEYKLLLKEKNKDLLKNNENRILTLNEKIVELEIDLEAIDKPDDSEDIEKQLKLLNEEKKKLNNDSIKYQTQIDREIELVSKIEGLKEEIKSLVNELESKQSQINNPVSQQSQMKSQLIMELGKNRSQVETQITELESNIKLTLNQKETYQIKATNEGVIHYINPIRIGMSVQQNQVLVDISGSNSEEFIVEGYINAQDISKVEPNQEANVAINGVNINKYGTLKGKLVSVDSGTISQETSEGNMLLYKVEISLEQYELKNKEDIINVISSMPVEARIVYEKETYFDWLLDKLNFKN